MSPAAAGNSSQLKNTSFTTKKEKVEKEKEKDINFAVTFESKL